MTEEKADKGGDDLDQKYWKGEKSTNIFSKLVRQITQLQSVVDELKRLSWSDAFTTDVQLRESTQRVVEAAVDLLEAGEGGELVMQVILNNVFIRLDDSTRKVLLGKLGFSIDEVWFLRNVAQLTAFRGAYLKKTVEVAAEQPEHAIQKVVEDMGPRATEAVDERGNS